MKRFTLFLIAISFGITATLAQGSSWAVDQVHSNAMFTVRHLLISEVAGKFNDIDISIVSSTADFTNAQIQAIIQVNSIDTGNESRDNHLRSDDFFNAEKYPEMRFKSNSIRKIGQNTYDISGELTIRDVSKPVTFSATHFGTVTAGQMGTRSGWKATANINRFDYNLTWDRMIETGGLVVGKDVQITMNLEFIKQ